MQLVALQQQNDNQRSDVPRHSNSTHRGVGSLAKAAWSPQPGLLRGAQESSSSEAALRGSPEEL